MVYSIGINDTKYYNHWALTIQWLIVFHTITKELYLFVYWFLGVGAETERDMVEWFFHAITIDMVKSMLL